MQMDDLQSQIATKSNEEEEKRPRGHCLNMEVLCALSVPPAASGKP